MKFVQPRSKGKTHLVSSPWSNNHVLLYDVIFLVYACSTRIVNLDLEGVIPDEISLASLQIRE